jgi:hypothetical protein
LAEWAYEKVIQGGIGMSQDPLPQASRPVVQAAAGSIADGMYYVSAAWTNGAGEEGAASLPATIKVSGGTLTARAASPAPSNARGWNVYVGASPQAMFQQNPTTLRLNETWTQTNPVTDSGRASGTGQGPNYMRPAPRIIQRG